MFPHDCFNPKAALGFLFESSLIKYKAQKNQIET